MLFVSSSLALLCLLFWLGLAFDRRRAWPRRHFLPEGVKAVAKARVTALVPARDEAEVVGDTVSSLLLQDLPGLEVLLVDDGSEDGTAEVARAAAASVGASERLQVLRAPSRPEGWSGKLHALAFGVDRLEQDHREPDWFLFTDADIHHHPGSLRGLLARAESGPFDLVSVMARLHAASFWEKLLIPPFVYFFQLLYPFRQVSRKTSSVAAAAGGCVLLRPAVLKRAGGLEAIRGAVIDDVSLARQVKRSGGRLWLGFDPGIVSVRPYRGLEELWGMVARSAFTQLGYRYWLVPLVLAGLAAFFAAPPFLVVVSLVEVLLGPSPPLGSALVTVLAASAAWGLEALALLPAVRHHRVPVLPFAFTLPLASVLYGAMTLASAWEHFRGRGSRWKGRTYGSELGRSGGQEQP
jgi:hopene-associated glycosyltransferase HpnB